MTSSRKCGAPVMNSPIGARLSGFHSNFKSGDVAVEILKLVCWIGLEDLRQVGNLYTSGREVVSPRGPQASDPRVAVALWVGRFLSPWRTTMQTLLAVQTSWSSATLGYSSREICHSRF